MAAAGACAGCGGSGPSVLPGEPPPAPSPLAWTETPGTREIPELNMTNDTGYRARLAVWGSGVQRTWDMSRGLATAVMPGEYQVTLQVGAGSDTHFQDLGDSNERRTWRERGR